MAPLVIDTYRLEELTGGSLPAPAADRLFRERGVFFVGGSLPVYETLVTMFDSFCMEATALFYLTLGSAETLAKGEEMARQIKKNFHCRLMARLDYAPATALLERLYAAGADSVDFHLAEVAADGELPQPVQAALQIFPRWSVSVTLSPGTSAAHRVTAVMDRLLQAGVVPLLQFSSKGGDCPAADREALWQHLAAGWERSGVNLAAYLPLLKVISPLTAARPAGRIRGLFERLRDQRQLAEADLRRHLRVAPATDSLDSAGL
jgi:hypothetical protein